MKDRFELSPSFLEPYTTKQPPFGFNGLGELVYKRTYARQLPDGTQETWWQTVQRVVEGCYNMQRRHILQHHLGWNAHKAQRSAQEMFDRIFHMKFLPPGRGLWAMGSALTEERGLYAALNNCFSGDTEFLTAEGVRTFSEAVGSTVRVLNRDGEFVPAQVNAFGVQPLQQVTFKPTGLRSNHALSVKVTPDHTWVLRDGTRTTTLKVGDVVQSSTAIVDRSDPEYTDGFRHGLVFGDGSRHTYYGDRFMIRLCGTRKQAFQSVLEDHERYVSTTVVEDEPLVTLRSDINLKELPHRYTNPAYIAGFIAGWAATDSYTKPSGSLSVDTQNAEAAAWLVQHAAIGGYIVTGQHIDSRATNYGERSAPLHRLSITDTAVPFTVTAVEVLSPELVYCVTEPRTSTFTLAGGLLTGNCAFVSTSDLAKDLADPFAFLMDASMLGIGVGFDTKGAGAFTLHIPSVDSPMNYAIADTREAWVDSVRELLLSYFVPGQARVEFDYSMVRPEGEPIRGFGGVSAGPEPLRQLHEAIRTVLDAGVGAPITVTQIVDVMNLIGKCVVAGNVRRTAEIAFGEHDSDEFLDLKNYEVNPHRAEYGWTSNNSIFAKLGMDYSASAERVALNGEPGYAWLDNMRAYGRMGDAPDFKDIRVGGGNPCLEQSLESYELCCLVETFPANHESFEDYARTLKFAYLYAKTVTLGNTPWERTNRVLLRNRRIGLSQSGIQQATLKLGIGEYIRWCNDGYQTVQHYDRVYSEWFAIPRSIKTTSVKPSGSVSLLAGATPGMHWPESLHYIRRMRLSIYSDLIEPLRAAGYQLEPAVGSESTTLVVEIPVKLDAGLRTVGDVSMWEQLAMAALLQRVWSDNQVSATITFDPVTEGPQIAHALDYYQYQLKGVSFLPRVEAGAYAQMPYEAITPTLYEARAAALRPIQFGSTREATEQERFCDGQSCVLL